MSKHNVNNPHHTTLVTTRRSLNICAIAALLFSQTAFSANAQANALNQTPASTETASAKLAVSPIDAEREISALLRQHLFDPSLLQSRAARQHLLKQQQLAAESTDLSDFVGKFNQLWREGPWSHVQLAPRRIPAAQMANFVDNMDAGPDAVQLSWTGNIPVLTVHTMMGKDTIEHIHQAFVQLQQAGAQQLIIDLRRNKGGAFAVKPLVGHLLNQPVEGGVFVSRRWYEKQPQHWPDTQDVTATAAWQQWNMQAFWQALITQPLVRIRFMPEQPVFAGQVWLLTSHNTASAAEMAVAALQQAGRVTVIGEQTAGEMLSQTMFDLTGDLQLSLPIATYIANQYGPIEGHGLVPDVSVPANQALPHALTLAAQASTDRPATKMMKGTGH
jgi:hypothetical protein